MREREDHEAVVIELTLERKYLAVRERVFAALTEPQLLRRWSAPAGLTVADGANDLRVGGGWRVGMVEPDGTRHEAFGTYREIDAPEWLVYTHAWRGAGGSSEQTVLTFELRPEFEGTRLILTQAGFGTAASRDGHREGWSSALDQLDAVLSGQRAAVRTCSPAGRSAV
jgi:uncharacterized protein YndB with AHSA1/START domain